MTVSPTAALRPVTTPDLWALIGCSIFIASRTMTRSPSATVAPSSTAILTMVPCIGAVSESPEAAAPALLPPERFGRLLLRRAAAAPPPPRDSPPGRDTSRRLPPTSTTIVCRSATSSSSPSAAAGPAAYGGMVLSNSVSIQRVCTVNGDPSDGANASSATTARWKGVTVGMPSMTSSSSARRARSMACGAVPAGDDELGDHRVERAGDGVALDEAGVPADAGAVRDDHARDGARGGQEAAAGVLAVDPELDGVRRAAPGR